jgi:hypothetical protein
MKKKLNLLVMLVSLLALSLVFIGCPTDSDDGGGGGGGGATVAERYRGVYKNINSSYGNWTLEVKVNTLEVKKGDGEVKIIPVEDIYDNTDSQDSPSYRIEVSNTGPGTSGGYLAFYYPDDPELWKRSIETNGYGKLQYYPGDDPSGEEIPRSWEEIQ